MTRWLAMIVIVPLAAVATEAHAQMKGLTAGVIADVARSREIDLRVTQPYGIQRTTPLMRGMIVRHDVAPNAAIGIGLANIYDRRRMGYDARPGERPSRSRKPAITFVLKF
jgi:hypothetical protein